MLFKNSARTSKRTPHFTITKINWLTLFKFNINIKTHYMFQPLKGHHLRSYVSLYMSGYLVTLGTWWWPFKGRNMYWDCLLPFDLPPQDACLQEIGDFIGIGQQERWYGGFEPRWRVGRVSSFSVLCRVMLVVEGPDFSTWTSKGFAVLQNDL
jgi:hypothetical protein